MFVFKFNVLESLPKNNEYMSQSLTWGKKAARCELSTAQLYIRNGIRTSESHIFCRLFPFSPQIIAAQEEMLRKERELEEARKKLAQIRQQQYKFLPSELREDEGWAARSVCCTDETLLSQADAASVLMAALLSYNWGIYSTWNRPV